MDAEGGCCSGCGVCIWVCGRDEAVRGGCLVCGLVDVGWNVWGGIDTIGGGAMAGGGEVLFTY